MKKVFTTTIAIIFLAALCPLVQAEDHGTPGEGKVHIHVVGGVVERGDYWVDATTGLEELSKGDSYLSKIPRIIPDVIRSVRIFRGGKLLLFRPGEQESDVYTSKLQGGDNINFPDLCGI